MRFTLQINLALLCLLWVFGYLPWHKFSYRYRFISGLWAFTCCWLCGVLCVQSVFPEKTPLGKYRVLIENRSLPQLRNQKIRMETRVLCVFGEKVQACDFPLMLYVQGLKEIPEPGQRWVAELDIQTPKNFTNSSGFDYSEWLWKKGYSSIARIKASALQAMPEKKLDFFLRLRCFSQRWKEALIAHSQSSADAALGLALLIGLRSDMDPEVLQSYVNTGTVHILAVSGMHVSLIWLLFQFALRPIRRWPFLAWAISFLLLWCYAALTGGSPSVVRACTVFSLLSFGRLQKRAASSWNALSVSAWIQLTCDPYALLDIGFQLSYAAVGGLFLLHPFLYSRLSFHQKWKEKIWENLSMTLSAQCFTFPISLYYFHQFPLFFWLANLVLIPLSTLCMGLGLAQSVALFCSPLAKALGVVFHLCSHLMNTLASFLSQLPYGVLYLQKPPLWVSFWLSLLFLFAVISLRDRNKQAFWGLILSLFVGIYLSLLF